MGIKTVITKIQNADIYLKGAVVSRHGSVTLKQGRNIVYMTGVSASSKSESIRLQFKGNVITRSTNVRTVGDLKEDNSAKKMASDVPLNSVVQDLADQMDALDREYTRLREHADMWEKNGDLEKAHYLSAEEMLLFLEKVQEQTDSLYTKMDDNRTQKKELAKKQSDAEKKDEQEDKKRILVADLWAEMEGEYEFLLSYFEPNASWLPRYEIIVESMERPLLIKLRGLVTQDTEEEWKKVSLRLYSGNPNTTNECPVQKPRYLYVNTLHQPSFNGYGMATTVMQPQRSTRNAETTILNATQGETTVLATRVYGMDADFSKTAKPLILEENEANLQNTMVEYILQESWDIDTGANGNLVDIRSYPMDVSYVCDTVPHIRTEAYLAAIVKEEEISQILSGIASVYLENNYVGQVNLGGLTVEKEMMIPLGKDGQVSVQHKLVRQNVSKTLLKGQIRKEYTYEIQIKNHKPYEMSFRIYDQIPVSRGNAISVDVIDLAGAQLNAETGEICWKMVFGAGETRKFRFSYAVSHPKDQTVFESSY